MQIAGVLVAGFIQTLIYLSQREDLETLIDDETYQELVTEIVESVVLMVGEKEFYEVFSSYQRHLLVLVSLNLMKTTKSEFETM